MEKLTEEPLKLNASEWSWWLRRSQRRKKKRKPSVYATFQSKQRFDFTWYTYWWVTEFDSIGSDSELGTTWHGTTQQTHTQTHARLLHIYFCYSYCIACDDNACSIESNHFKHIPFRSVSYIRLARNVCQKNINKTKGHRILHSKMP